MGEKDTPHNRETNTDVLEEEDGQIRYSRDIDEDIADIYSNAQTDASGRIFLKTESNGGQAPPSQLRNESSTDDAGYSDERAGKQLSQLEKLRALKEAKHSGANTSQKHTVHTQVNGATYGVVSKSQIITALLFFKMAPKIVI